MVLRAFIIGIDQYRSLDAVPFGTDDATAIEAALKAIGGPETVTKLLLDADASKISIEEDLAEFVQEAAPEDILYFFFAGHGFWNGSFNYLAAHDSRIGRFDETWVKLQKVIALVKASQAKRKVIFLDACNAGADLEEGFRGDGAVSVDLDEEEDVEFVAGFAACRKDEKSVSHPSLGHGVWTHFLLRALRGEANEVLDGTAVDAAKLQKYLLTEVKAYVAHHFTNRTQRPRTFGGHDAVPAVADLRRIIAARQKKANASTTGVRRLRFVKRYSTRVSALDGFDKKRGHYVPTYRNDTTREHVRAWAGSELNEHIEDLFNGLKKSMGWVRKDGATYGVESGRGSIRAPGFEYDVVVDHARDDLELAAWHRVLRISSSEETLDKDEFNEPFSGVLHAVEVKLPKQADSLEGLIDALEAAGHEVMHDQECTEVKFALDDPSVQVTVELDKVTLEFGGGHTPKDLFDLYRSARAQLDATEEFSELFAV